MAGKAKNAKTPKAGKRGAKSKVVPLNGGAAGAGHNSGTSKITDDMIRHHVSLCLPAKELVDKAKEAQQKAMGAYRALLAAAKKDQIDPEWLTSAFKIDDEDLSAAKMKSEGTRRVLQVMKSKKALLFAEQLDIFDAPAPQNAAATINDTGDAAFAQGEQACMDGDENGSNPYEHGTDQHAAWNNGFQQEMTRRLAGDAAPEEGAATTH